MAKEASSHGSFTAGDSVWVGPDYKGASDDVYTLKEVLRIGPETVSVKNGTGTDEVSLARCFGANPKLMSDLCGLHNIHEAGILANLEGRIGKDDPLAYTFLNTVLVAVNPLKQIKNQPSFDDYVDKAFNPDAPHPYAIAELSYQNLRTPRESEPTSQSIVISGESGAGKTETAKIVLAYLSNRSSGDGVVDVGNARVSECILDSTPIFEEFGNAKTTRNDNSSRFGKFISLQFSPELSYTLIGAFVTTYLLEKTRVCYQMPGERNYHIFYDLLSCAGRTNSELCLEPTSTMYHYLNPARQVGSGSSTDDAQFSGEQGMFDHVSNAFDVIGIGEDKRLEIWKLLAGILHLGNTAITEADTVEGLKAAITDEYTRNAALAANLFGVSAESLLEILTVKKTNVRGQEIVIKLQMAEATFRRDAVSKALYDGLFTYLVDAANDHLGYKKGEPLPFIGVLDIFGFESFKVNGLEQILINFANEYLQNVFNKQVFEAELKLFKEENILCSLDDYPDNRPCVELLSNKGGILDILNEQCAQVKPSEDKFVRDLVKDHKSSSWFPAVHRKDARDSFKVQHFAGAVQYTVSGWLLKNTDPLPESMPAIFGAGQLPLVRKIFEPKRVSAAGDASSNATDASSSASGAGRRVTKKPGITTVSKAFVASMKSLTTNLAATKCNFIRCIKPNPLMRAGLYNRRYVVDQLRCLGILATCEVLKAGMPTRVTYQELRTALANLPRSTLDLFTGQPEEVMIAASMWAFEVPADAYQLGRTRVFFKAGEISRVERMIKVDLSGDAGKHINERMQIALERRRQALEAVRGVDVIMARARPGVEHATQTVEDLEDCARQINRDSASAIEALSKAAAQVVQITTAVRDSARTLEKVKTDPIFALVREGGEVESETVPSTISAADAALATAESALETITTDHDIEDTRQRYSMLKKDAHDLSTDTRQLVKDILAGFAKVEKLHIEAEDGAKRCLLDYTMQRTQAAEAEAESVLALITEIQDGNDVHAKSKAFEETNASLRDGVASLIPSVEENIAQAKDSMKSIASHIKSVRSEMRKAETKLAEEKRAAAQAAALAAGASAAEAEAAGKSAVSPVSSSVADGIHKGVRSRGGDGSGDGGMVVSAEFESIVEGLQDKVKMIEKHHGEQLRALVAKTKELHRIVKLQQNQLQSSSTVINSTIGAGVGTGGLTEALAALETAQVPPLPPPERIESGMTNEGTTPDSMNLAESMETGEVSLSGAPANEIPVDASEKTGGMSDAMSKVLAMADSSESVTELLGENESVASMASPEIKDGTDNLMTPQGITEDEVAAHKRMLDREAVLLDRISKQEKKLATLAGAEGRVASAEARVEKLEGLVERLQQDLQKAMGDIKFPASAPLSPKDDDASVTRKMRRAKEGAMDTNQQLVNAKIGSNENDTSLSGGSATSGGIGPSSNDSASSRLSLWANIRDRMFGGGAARARMLNLTILEATFHDTSRNQKLPLDAFIEIRNITTGQVEMTSTVRKSYKPKYNEHFVFRTKQNANDMIMMKIMENSGGQPVIFGSVALPLDSKHTQGAQIPMPIFDEGLNMKGVVRVAAKWVINYPRRVKVSLFGLQDLPEDSDATAATVRFFSTNSSQTAKPSSIMAAGFASFEGQTLDQLELADEVDLLQVEVLLLQDITQMALSSFGRAPVPLPKDGISEGHDLVITSKDGSRRATMHIKLGWVE